MELCQKTAIKFSRIVVANDSSMASHPKETLMFLGILLLLLLLLSMLGLPCNSIEAKSVSLGPLKPTAFVWTRSQGELITGLPSSDCFLCFSNGLVRANTCVFSQFSHISHLVPRYWLKFVAPICCSPGIIVMSCGAWPDCLLHRSH